jgi:uncharacterized protein (DUF1778 family)
MAKRSGSETRRKNLRVIFRVTEDEQKTLQEAAEGAGLTLASYARETLLAAPQTRKRRRPSIEVQTIARLQAEMNRVGSHIYQLVRRVNFGATPEAGEIYAAFDGYRDVIAAILAALGRK